MTGEPLVETAVFTATGATTARQWKDHVGDILNVRDFGAIGDSTDVGGGTDDTVAIQRCFDTAFGGSTTTGSNTTPHGVTNAKNNRAVFFPNGTYKITSALQLTDVYGALIFGANPMSTVIFPQHTTGGLVDHGVLTTNGFSHSCIRDITFGLRGGSNFDSDVVCVDLDWAGSNSAGLGHNLFLNFGFGSPSYGGVGIRIGHSTSTQGAGTQLIQTAAGGNPCLLLEGAGCTNTLIQNGAWGGETTVQVLGGSIAIQSLVLTRETTVDAIYISTPLPCAISDSRSEQAAYTASGGGGTPVPNNTFLRVIGPGMVMVSGISTSEFAPYQLPHFANINGNATVIFDPSSVYGDVVATAGCNLYFRGVNMPDVDFTTLSGLGVIRQHI